MSNEFRSKAIDLVTQATEKDHQRNYEEALPLYRLALEYFITDLKYEKNPQVKATLKLKIEDYIKRAEDIKQFLDQNAPKQSKSKPTNLRNAQSTVGGQNSSNTDTGDDSDTDSIESIHLSKCNTFKKVTGADDQSALEYLTKHNFSLPSSINSWFQGYGETSNSNPNSPNSNNALNIGVMRYLESELKKLIGLESIKQNLRELVQKQYLDQLRRQRNLPVVPEDLNMVFLGNPGVGKTKIALLLAEIYHVLGILQTPKLVVCQRSDLVAGYIGQTAIQTRNKIKSASGGIFFLDEAYRLSDAGESNEKDFGKEAIDEIMRHMDIKIKSEEGVMIQETIFVFAGYKSVMKRFLNVNQGFKRRVGFTMEFGDYSCEEIGEMVLRKMEGMRLRVEEGLGKEEIGRMIEEKVGEEMRRNMNGGLAEKMVERGMRVMSLRLDWRRELSDEELVTIQREDLEKSLEQIVQASLTD